MALGDYKDAYAVDIVKQRVRDIASELKATDIQNLVNTQKGELNSQLEILKEKENSLFASLNVEDINALNERLKLYNQFVFRLSGPELYKYFIWQVENSININPDIFEDAARQALVEILKQGGNQNASLASRIGEAERKTIQKALSQQGIKGKTHLRSKQAYLSKDTIESFNFLAMTGPEIKLLQKYILNSKNIKSDGLNKYKEGVDSAQVNNNKDSVDIIFNWREDTKKLTPTEAKKLTDNDRDAINSKIKKYISEQVVAAKLEDGKKFNPTNLIKTIIDHVLTENPYEFFIGKNENQITGSLGEIQSLFYLCLLTGDTTGKEVLGSNLFWRGGKLQNGIKPHQDIVLNNLGIQIKNTTKDLLKDDLDVGFKSKKLFEFLSDIGITDSNIKNLFINYFCTYVFNVPYIYKQDEDKYVQSPYADENFGEGKEFNITREELISLQSDIDKLMSLFSAIIMYMDIEEGVEKLDANILYILGGTTAITASQIINDTLVKFGDVNKVSSFQGELDVKSSGKYNIVTKLNNDKNILTLIRKNKKDAQLDSTLSQEIMDSIFLKSSYLFKFTK